MLRKCLLLILGGGLLLFSRGVMAADPPPRDAWIPQEALLVLDVPQPRAVLEHLFAPQTVRAIQEHPEYRRRQAAGQLRDLQNLADYFRGRYNTSLQEVLGRLLGGGATVAIGPQQSFLLIADAEDAQVLRETHEFFLAIARAEADKAGAPERVASAEYRGVTGWTFGPNEAHALIGKRLVVASKPALVKEVIDRSAAAGGAALADVPEFQQARQALPPAAVGSLFVRLDVLKQLPQVTAALQQDRNPLATLLLAPLMQTLQQSDWLSAGLSIDGPTLSLQIAADGRPDEPGSPAGFARSDQPDGGALPNLNVPRQIAAASLYRDLHQFYAAKDELFPERTSGLIFFENMMGIFFTGRDLTDEVLAELAPEVRIVVAQQQYDSRIGTPGVQLPAVALVFRMRDPQKFAPVAEEAWQKAIGLINFTRGQQAQPGLIIDRPTLSGVKYTVAAFGPAGSSPDSPVDLRFNFQPAIAMPGEYLILSSTEGLTRDLIESLVQQPAGKPVPGTHSIVEIRGRQLAALLDANREALIAQNMVEKGHGRQQAETEIDTLTRIARLAEHLKLAAGSETAQQLHLQLKLDLQP